MINEDKLIEILTAKAEWWRTTQNDPHGISVAMYIAMNEMADAVRKSTAPLRGDDEPITDFQDIV